MAGAAREQLESEGYDTTLHDLYAENFDPLLLTGEIPTEGVLDSDIRDRCDELTKTTVIVLVHPNWWGQPPAILKGWVDRVIRPGVAYRFEENDQGDGVPVGLLKGKTVLVFNTSNTPETREHAVFGDPLQLVWWNCIFSLCGVSHFSRKMFGVVITSTAEERAAWLTEVKETVARETALCS